MRCAATWNRGCLAASLRSTIGRTVPDDVLQVRAPFVCFHVLRDADGLYLIDAGFVGGVAALQRALRRRGWASLPLKGILLTHGHIDHTFNLARLAREHGAWVAAPRLDAEHCAGRYPYTGLARACGWLEAGGRAVFGDEHFAVDYWLDDRAELPVCGGLTAIHLPGHTIGHMGFYSPTRRLLFTGDLFCSYFFGAFLPPPILNSCPALLESSIARIGTLALDGVLPNHGDAAAADVHLRRVRRRWPAARPLAGR
jgi:glyoxylase-like metal-dependent hydrolase (beta-lactamase superfamily II)